jgi:hypothetical protein
VSLIVSGLKATKQSNYMIYGRDFGTHHIVSDLRRKWSVKILPDLQEELEIKGQPCKKYMVKTTSLDGHKSTVMHHNWEWATPAMTP